MAARRTGRVLAGAVLVAALSAAALGVGAAAGAGPLRLGDAATASIGSAGRARIARTAAVGAGAAARTIPGRTARTTAVGVGAREYRFAVYRTRVPRGIVRFNLTNFGEDAHDLVVETRGGRRLGRTGRVRSGARATLALRLAPGTYRLVCDLADHAALGMRTTIRVTR